MPKGIVLVVVGEDQAGESIGHALVRRGYEVSLAASGAQALALAHHAAPDLVILDMDSSETDAIGTCTELRAFVMAPIIVMGAGSDEADILLSLGVGADAYLAKPVGLPILLAHVDAAIRRETTYRHRQNKTKPLYVRDLIVDLAGCELRRNGAVIPLSPTEFRLIRTLARNAGRVLTRNQLLDSVWETRAENVYSRTVDVHIGRLRRKIEDDPSQPSYILTVNGVGYKMREGSDQGL